MYFLNKELFMLLFIGWLLLYENGCFVFSGLVCVVVWPIRLQLYGHLPPITKTIQVRRTRHAGHCWRSKDELISDVLLWTPTHGCASVGRPARTYIQQLCEDTGCNPEDLPEAMSDREKWRERVRDIRADGATWWWIVYKRILFIMLFTWFTGAGGGSCVSWPICMYLAIRYLCF